jgi:exosortase O
VERWLWKIGNELAMNRREIQFKNLAVLLTNVALLAGWFWLYRAVYPYLGVIFTAQEFRTNQIILLGILALILHQVRKGELRPHLNNLPQLYSTAILLALGSSILYLLVERYLDVNTFSASLFGLASYGLLGLWMQPRDWRRGLPTALLLVGVLPFGEHLQTFVGYPLRVLTATIVRDGLGALGVHSISADTILVFESGFSKVDLPCSGIKSLWTGGLFLLAATLIERRPINFRWLLVCLGMDLLLLAANLGRVAALVLVGQVAGLSELAAMLHVPLGVLGFVGSSFSLPALGRSATKPDSPRSPRRRPPLPSCVAGAGFRAGGAGNGVAVHAPPASGLCTGAFRLAFSERVGCYALDADCPGT